MVAEKNPDMGIGITKLLEFTKAYGIPTVLVILLLWWIVKPITDDYRAMATRTIEIQGQMSQTLKEISQVQSNQARTLDELARITQRSTECLQRVEEAVRRLDTRASLAPGARQPGS